MITYVHKETGVKIEQSTLKEFIIKYGPMAELAFHMRKPMITEFDENDMLVCKGSIVTMKYEAFKIPLSEDFEVVKEETEFTLEELIMMSDSVRNSYRDLPVAKELHEKIHKRIVNIYNSRQ